MPQQITADEWRQELMRALSVPDGDGLTAQELADSMNVSRRTVGEYVRALHRAGRIVVGYRMVPGLLRPNKTPVYRLKE